MKKIYVITATRGGYSDWQKWITGVYHSKEEAETYQKKAREWKDTILAQYGAMRFALRVRVSPKFKKSCGKYDPELLHNLSADVEYWVNEVPMLSVVEAEGLQC
jgi:hypothetical protein